MSDFANDFENLVNVFDDRPDKEGLDNLLEEVKTEASNRSKHVLNTERWFKKRFGIRPRVVNWPWPNASNLHLPQVDKTIRRNKPIFANLITTFPTVALESNIMGEDMDLVRGLERKFHNMMHDEDKMGVDLSLFWGIDLMLERGRFITKVVQEFTPVQKTEQVDIRKLPEPLRRFIEDPRTTDEELRLELADRFDMDLDDDEDRKQIDKAIRQFRDGKEVVEFEREINETPHPSLFVRDPLSVLFPSDTTYIISQARWIRDRIPMAIQDIENRVQKGIWNKQNGNELLNRITDEKRTQNRAFRETNDAPGPLNLEQIREGVQPSPFTGPVIDEIYFWKKLDKRFAERVVLTVDPENSDIPLRMIRYPYRLPDNQPEDWPFDQVQFEIPSDRANAPRGYPQLLDSLQTEITNNHNAKQNYMTMANTLHLVAKRNSGVQTQWIPGQPIWVNRQDDVRELKLNAKDTSFDNEESILKSWSDEYIGVIDSAVLSTTGQAERRTKAEIDTLSAIQSQTASFDVRVFQSFMQRVYQRIWNRWMQFGEDEIEIMDPHGNVRSIFKEEVQTRLRPKPRANLFNSNRQLMQQQAGAMVQTLAGNPIADQFELFRNWVNLVDERMAETVLKRPSQVTQGQIERFVDDIDRISMGYRVIPRPDDDNRIAVQVIDDFIKDPKKRRNMPKDRLQILADFRKAHVEALKQKSRATTREGRTQQEVTNIALGERGREARETTTGAEVNGS